MHLRIYAQIRAGLHGKNVAGRQKKTKIVFCRFCRFCRPTRIFCRRATKTNFCSRGFFFFQTENPYLIWGAKRVPIPTQEKKKNSHAAKKKLRLPAIIEPVLGRNAQFSLNSCFFSRIFLLFLFCPFISLFRGKIYICP